MGERAAAPSAVARSVAQVALGLASAVGAGAGGALVGAVGCAPVRACWLRLGREAGHSALGRIWISEGVLWRARWRLGGALPSPRRVP